MTTSERLAVAYEEAVRALAARAAKAGVPDAEDFARDFITALHGQGWRPYAPVTVLPSAHVRAVPPPEGWAEQCKRQIHEERARREARPHTEGDTA